MTFPNDHILVKFDPVPTATGLIIPERYLIQEDDVVGKSYGVTTDRRLINPQMVTVVKGNEEWRAFVSDKYPEPERKWALNASSTVKSGNRYFVHYGAYEVRMRAEEGLYIIPSKTVMFQMEPILPVSGTYIGEEVFTDDVRTQSGIILQEGAKEAVQVKIIYSGGIYHPGDIVITQDPHQYTFRYENKHYIYVKDNVIIGKLTADGIEPAGNCLLVEYIADGDEIRAENDRRAKLKDFMDKNHLHYPQADLTPLPEPKTVHARCIKGELAGEELLINRNFGTPIGNQWIINMQTVLGTVCPA